MIALHSWCCLNSALRTHHRTKAIKSTSPRGLEVSFESLRGEENCIYFWVALRLLDGDAVKVEFSGIAGVKAQRDRIAALIELEDVFERDLAPRVPVCR